MSRCNCIFNQHYYFTMFPEKPLPQKTALKASGDDKQDWLGSHDKREKARQNDVERVCGASVHLIVT